jgi:hypothetical protein
LQGDSAVTALKRLQRIEKEQKEEIARLKADLERLNKTWQMKFAVLQRTLHAVKDESYLRTSLHRQSSRLHHATVTYAVSYAYATGICLCHVKCMFLSTAYIQRCSVLCLEGYTRRCSDQTKK